MSKLEQVEKALQAKLQEKGWSSDDDSEMEEGGGDVTSTKNCATTKGKSTTTRTTKAGGGKKLVRDHDASKKNRGSGVLYIGHLPREFGEYELKKLFSQFGTVKRVRVARSQRTGGHKGYAFVEMSSSSVASIIADTFSGYLLMGKRRLVCHVVPPDQVNVHRMFAKRPKTKPEEPPSRTLNQMQVITDRLLEREKARRKKLAEIGIDYDFPGYEAGNKKVASPAGKAQTEAVSNVEGTATERADLSSEKKKEKTSLRKESASSMELESEIETPKSRTKKRKDSDASLDKAPDRKYKQQSPHKESPLLQSSSKKESSKRKDSDASDQRPTSASKHLETDSDIRKAAAQSKVDSTPPPRDTKTSSGKKQPKLSHNEKERGSASAAKQEVDAATAEPQSSVKEAKPKKSSQRDKKNDESISATPRKDTSGGSSTDRDKHASKSKSEKKHKKEKKKKDKDRRASVP